MGTKIKISRRMILTTVVCILLVRGFTFAASATTSRNGSTTTSSRMDASSSATSSLPSSNSSVRRRTQQQQKSSSLNEANDNQNGQSLTNEINLRGGSTIIAAREGKIRELKDSLGVLQYQIEKYITGITEENERKLYSLQQRVMFYQQQIDIETIQLENDKRQQQSPSQQIFQQQQQQQQSLNNQNKNRNNERFGLRRNKIDDEEI